MHPTLGARVTSAQDRASDYVRRCRAFGLPIDRQSPECVAICNELEALNAAYSEAEASEVRLQRARKEWRKGL
jgi:hypothetical protein